ncbi:hypothetical protein [Salinibacterium sp.]|uniref:hypothetical protein n=1 Tax=Salinibacterium sp. TaxID=1915057 RepID=UPI00286B1BFC|nr:hypothetical protein [Salinibacterium sp.]
MPTPSRIPAELGDVFSVPEALRAGVSRKRLRARDLQSPFRGGRSIPVPISTADPFARQHHDLVERCRAFAAIAPAKFCFSNVTAAALYGIPLPHRVRADLRLDVGVPAGRQPPRRRGVRGHRMDDWVMRTVLGMPVVDPAVAWAQVASLLTLNELIVAGDFMVRRKLPFSTLDAMIEAAHAARRGGPLARSALLEVRPGTDSPPETETRLVLVRGGLPEPVVGYTVYHEGYFVGTPDLAYVAEKIAIEYQGSGHWLDPAVFEDDIGRRELFERAGWKVILVTAPRLRHPTLLVTLVRDALRERAVA